LTISGSFANFEARNHVTFGLDFYLDAA